MKKIYIIISALLAAVMLVSVVGAINVGNDEGNCVIRVATYNLRSLQDVNFDSSVIAKDILDHGVEIVGFQEVDVGTDRYNGRNMMEELSKATGYEYYKFAKSYVHDNGLYGTGVLSKYPIEEFDIAVLPTFGQEDRRLTHSVINVNGTKIDFFNTHLSTTGRDVRAAQFNLINQFTSECEYFFVTADYNTGDFTEFEAVENSNIINNSETRMVSCGGDGAIDNIIYSKNFKAEDWGMYDEVTHSDHKMIWAEFSYKPAAE